VTVPRYKLTIEYDGEGYAGWQRQPDQKSIQQKVEEAITQFSQEEQPIYVAGRTDAGVHAVGQVVHFDLNKENFTPYRIMEALNYHLRGSGIVILDVVEVSDEFHARFSALKRAYYYRIINRRPPLAIEKGRAWHIKPRLDVDAMREGAAHLIGQHDFTSFRDSECQANTPIRSINKIDFLVSGDEIQLHIEAKSFLHHMVRNITGTLKLVGAGKISAADVKDILEAKDRREAGPTAPACGLYLSEIFYAEK
jgi:tRNA pseudouridine38-40 synthase